MSPLHFRTKKTGLDQLKAKGVGECNTVEAKGTQIPEKRAESKDLIRRKEGRMGKVRKENYIYCHSMVMGICRYVLEFSLSTKSEQ